MGNISVVASQSAPVVVANDVEVRNAPSDSKFNQSKGSEEILLNVETDGATKGVANQISDKVITLPDPRVNEEDWHTTTEGQAAFIEKDFERWQQDLYLKGSPEDTYKVNERDLNKSGSYEDFNKRLPYTMSPDGEIVAKSATESVREKPIYPFPYVESDAYTSEEDLTKGLKNSEVLSESYWTKRDAHESLVDSSAFYTSVVVGTGATLAGGAIGTLTSPVTGPVGPVMGGTVLGVAGTVYGETLGEKVIAPAIHYLDTSDKELKREEYASKMKEVYQARFGDKWEKIDIAKTMELLPPGVQREAFYEAFMDRPKQQKFHSEVERSGLHKTIDKAGNEGYLMPGTDPEKRPNIGLDIGGDFQPAIMAGFYGDAFLDNKFKKNLGKHSDKLHLSDDQIKFGKELMAGLRKSGMAVLPRIELFYDVNSGGTNLIVYARPNQIKGLVGDKTLGKHIKAEMKKLPMKLRKMTTDDLKKEIGRQSNPMNSGFRVSIPFKGSISESVKNMNVGYFFEKTLFKDNKYIDQFGVAINVAAVIRTIPTNELTNHPKGTTFFTSIVGYVSNEGDMSNKPDKNEKENKFLKGVMSVPKAVGYGLSKFSPEGFYLAGGGYYNVASTDPTGKVINEEGHEVYTTDAILSWLPGDDNDNNTTSEYFQLSEEFTDILDMVSPD